MNIHSETVGGMGLQFLGKINASISHEIKNVLAVINENAGLIKDMLIMAEKGRPLDNARINTQVEKVLAQVRRADKIVDNMNRFAHSVDNPLAQIDINKCLEFVVSLSERFSAMRGVSLELEPSTDLIEIITSPFMLENLIYLCLDFAMEICGEGRKVIITIKKNDGGARITFAGLKDLGRNGNIRFHSEEGKALTSALGAVIEENIQVGELILILPDKSDN